MASTWAAGGCKRDLWSLPSSDCHVSGVCVGGRWFPPSEWPSPSSDHQVSTLCVRYDEWPALDCQASKMSGRRNVCHVDSDVWIMGVRGGRPSLALSGEEVGVLHTALTVRCLECLE
jgi:hypothetical protein